MLCDIISMQCFTSVYHKYVLMANSTLLASSSSPSITQMDTTRDIIVKSTETADMTSGKQNLLKILHKIYVCQNIHIDI